MRWVEPELSKGRLADAMPLILKHHYTQRRTADPMHVFMWKYLEDLPVATAVFTSPVNRYFGKGAIELARLVRVPELEVPMSLLISRCLKWLKQNTDLAYCLSYADTSVGRAGFVYQASNFTHVARSKGNVQYRHLESGKVVSGRSFDQHAQGNKEGWERIRTGEKLLYVYPLAEKRQALLDRFGWEPLPYPKSV